MYVAFLVVSLLAAFANGYAATMDFIRDRKILNTMQMLAIPASWLPLLGVAKALGAIGFIAGLFKPVFGEITAICLTLFFVAAIIAHLRKRNHDIGAAIIFLLLSLAVLALAMALSKSQSLSPSQKHSRYKSKQNFVR